MFLQLKLVMHNLYVTIYYIINTFPEHANLFLEFMSKNMCIKIFICILWLLYDEFILRIVRYHVTMKNVRLTISQPETISSSLSETNQNADDLKSTDWCFDYYICYSYYIAFLVEVYS